MTGHPSSDWHAEFGIDGKGPPHFFGGPADLGSAEDSIPQGACAPPRLRGSEA